MKKLLNITIQYYAAISVVLLLLTSPLFYSITKSIYMEDVEEEILQRKEEFLNERLPTLQENEIHNWNLYSRNFEILDTIIYQLKNTMLTESFYNNSEKENELYRVLYSDIKINNKSYTICIKRSILDSDDIIETTAILYIIILFVLIFVLLFITRIVSRRLWSPFYQTLTEISNFNIEKHFMPEFSTTRIVEFEMLNISLEKLIRQNMSALEREKEFIENASHELQTPLAVFTSKLDLLIQNPALTDSQSILLQHLYNAAARLSRINRNLLLLSKIENKHYSEKETMDVVEILKGLLPYFEEQLLEKKITIVTQIEGQLIVYANRGLLEILIQNLLLNAIRHNRINGEVTICIAKNIFQISNTGSPEKLIEKNLFKRFSSSNRNTQNSGLGLSIVKKIVDLNSWILSYHFEDGVHHFKVGFVVISP